jgi:hypothetical protein
MEDAFEIPVSFNGKEYNFTAEFISYGYAYKLEIDIDGSKIQFEPDEERNWRALISQEDRLADKKLNSDLLGAIASAIDAIVK